MCLARPSSAAARPLVRAKVASPEAPPIASGPIILNGQVLHSIEPARLELVKSLGSFVEQNVREAQLRRLDVCYRPTCRLFSTQSAGMLGAPLVCWDMQIGSTNDSRARVVPPAQVLPVLKPVDKCWQPADFLPPSEDPDFLDMVRLQAQKLRSAMRELGNRCTCASKGQALLGR